MKGEIIKLLKKIWKLSLCSSMEQRFAKQDAKASSIRGKLWFDHIKMKYFVLRKTLYTVARQGKYVAKHMTDYNPEYIRNLCKSARSSQETRENI